MAYVFRFPDIADGLSEGRLGTWKVKEGDLVETDQVLCDLETDKAVTDMPSPVSGRIIKLHFPDGAKVKVGDPLVTFEEEGGTAEAGKPEQMAAAKQHDKSTPLQNASKEREQETIFQQGKLMLPKDRKLAQNLNVDTGAIQGSGPNGRITEADIHTAAKIPVTARNTDQAQAKAAAEREKVQRLPINVFGQGRLPPHIRQLMREQANTNAAPAMPTQAAAEIRRKQYTAESSQARPGGQILFSGNFTRQKIEGIREIIKKKMELSWRTVPHCVLAAEADVTKLVKAREKAKKQLAKKGIHLTYLPYIIKAVASALHKFPKFNASVDDAAQEIIFKHEYNIGIAVDTPHGLMVPNIRHADSKSIDELAREIQGLSKKAQERKLTLDELRNGTFTISNGGSFGASGGTAIINYPETAILLLGAIKDVLKREGTAKIKAKKIMPMSLTFDHRIIDGAEAGRFMKFITDAIEDMETFMLEAV